MRVRRGLIVSVTALSVIAFLAAMPVTWCVRRMVLWVPTWLDQAERASRPGMDVGSRWMPQPMAPTGSSLGRGRMGVSFAMDGLAFSCLAALFVLSVMAWGATLQALTAMILVSMLLALTWIDLETGLLPDVLTKTGLGLGLVINVWSVWVPWGDAVIGALAGYWLMWLFFHLYLLATKKEGMGYGDFKLFAMLGAWFGWESLAPLLLVAALAALTVASIGMVIKRWTLQSSLPFGPFLAFGGILRLFGWL